MPVLDRLDIAGRVSSDEARAAAEADRGRRSGSAHWDNDWSSSERGSSSASSGDFEPVAGPSRIDTSRRSVVHFGQQSGGRHGKRDASWDAHQDESERAKRVRFIDTVTIGDEDVHDDDLEYPLNMHLGADARHDNSIFCQLSNRRVILGTRQSGSELRPIMRVRLGHAGGRSFLPAGMERDQDDSDDLVEDGAFS